jgi:hypothetical protein
MALTTNLTAYFKSHKAINNSATKYCIKFELPWNSVKNIMYVPAFRQTANLYI